MSQSPQFDIGTNLYRYIVIGVLSAVVCVGVLLFWRSRVVERRLPRGPLPSRMKDILGERPTMYDVYLDGHGTSWHDIMPVSIHRVGPPSSVSTSAKHATIDVDPLACAHWTVAL
ncbi:hypothetical protein K438DRAFT_948104 [Mycena galopus ATCC 62051]|nr:hypothetical protein K438DRAFT_948104 [Mycena galopus ATCC 62051]